MRDELPKNWEITSVGKAFITILGQSPPSSTYNYEEVGLPFFQGKAEFGEKYPKIVKWCSSPKKIAESGDVLLSVRAPVGPTNLAPSKCCIGRGLAAIRPICGVDSRFVLYIFRHLQNKISGVGTGTTFKAITGSQLNGFPILLPPLPEQNRIVSKIEELLTRSDGGIESLKQVQALLKQYHQSVLKSAVEGKLTSEFRKQHKDELEPADKLLDRILKERKEKWEVEQLANFKAKGRKPPKNWQSKYKEPTPPDTSQLPKLPKGWEWVSIDQVSVVVRGASPRPAGDPKYFGGDIPWITVGALTADESPYLYQVKEFVTDEGCKKSRYIEPETLLLTNSGATLGVPKITKIGGCINDGSVAMFHVDYPLKLFLYYFFKTIIKRLRNINQGAAQPNLNTGIVKNIVVPLPPLNEQKIIIEEVERAMTICFDIEKVVVSEIKRSHSLEQSILKRAFEGKLVSQDPNDEPASVLLERIKAEKSNPKKTKPMEKF